MKRPGNAAWTGMLGLLGCGAVTTVSSTDAASAGEAATMPDLDGGRAAEPDGAVIDAATADGERPGDGGADVPRPPGCAPGAVRRCYSGPPGSEAVGACQPGMQRCGADGDWGAACAGEVIPAPESCNGRDDDCDGAVDEDLPLTRCGLGACARTVPGCRDGVAPRCEPGAPAMEICDGEDNDCDGVVDEAPEAIALCPTPPRGAAACRDGRCAVGACREPFLDCDREVANGCEIDGSRSNTHCGRCGHACGADTYCGGGRCEGAAGVAAGISHSCAVLRSGRVLCWGSNSLGQLGDGTTLDHRVPAEVVGLTDAVEITAGLEHTCARLRSGGVWCWGDAAFVGDGDLTRRSARQPTPVAVVGLTDVVQVSAAPQHTCAVRRGGGVVCWGSNRQGQLGNGYLERQVDGYGVPNTVVMLSDAVQVAPGAQHTCALRRGGAVVCWGDNTHGQLGDGTDERRLTPTPVRDLTDAVQLSSGSWHTCALRLRGEVVCWGHGLRGQTGTGRIDLDRVPVIAVRLMGAAMVAASAVSTCVAQTDGRVVCVGENRDGLLGGGGEAEGRTGVVVPGLTDATLLAGHRNLFPVAGHYCAVRRTGGVVCWGRNPFGQLGDGTTEARREPVPILRAP